MTKPIHAEELQIELGVDTPEGVQYQQIVPVEVEGGPSVSLVMDNGVQRICITDTVESSMVPLTDEEFDVIVGKIRDMLLQNLVDPNAERSEVDWPLLRSKFFGAVDWYLDIGHHQNDRQE